MLVGCIFSNKIAHSNSNTDDCMEWHPFAALGHSPPLVIRRPGTLAALGHSPPWDTRRPGPLAALATHRPGPLAALGDTCRPGPISALGNTCHPGTTRRPGPKKFSFSPISFLSWKFFFAFQLFLLENFLAKGGEWSQGGKLTGW